MLPSARGGLVLSDALENREELDQRVRLRVLVDLLRSIDPGCIVRPRGPRSRLHIGNCRIGPDGAAHLVGEGDDSGAAALCWEILASRPLPRGPSVIPCRIHETVDEIHPDVDDVVERAFRGELETIRELLAELERFAGSFIGELNEVTSAFALGTIEESGTVNVSPGTTPSILLIGLSEHDASQLGDALEEVGVRAHSVPADRWQRARRPKRLAGLVVQYSADAFELILAVRGGPLRLTPLIVLAPEASVEEANALGAELCVALPCNSDDLILQILSVIRGA